MTSRVPGTLWKERRVGRLREGLVGGLVGGRRRRSGRGRPGTGGAVGEAPPVFVGGTGRSGTTIVAELIAQSRRYALVPIEIHFHAQPGGLADVLEGRTGVEEFRREVLERWHYRKPNNSGPRGLQVIAEEQAVRDALARFGKARRRHRSAAAGALLHELLDPVAREQGKPGWVEMSPPTLRVVDTLGRAMPHAKFVHMVRDGRDVASSVVRRRWGPNDLRSALAWWEEEITSLFAAQQRLPSDRVLTVGLEDLVVHRREESLRRLTTYLGIEQEEALRTFFDHEMLPESARTGRWRRGLSESEAREIDEAYARARSRLEEAGYPLP